MTDPRLLGRLQTRTGSQSTVGNFLTEVVDPEHLDFAAGIVGPGELGLAARRQVDRNNLSKVGREILQQLTISIPNHPLIARPRLLHGRRACADRPVGNLLTEIIDPENTNVLACLVVPRYFNQLLCHYRCGH